MAPAAVRTEKLHRYSFFVTFALSKHKTLMIKRIFLILMLSASLSATGQTRQIPRSQPEACGIPSAAVAHFFDSLMVIPRTSIHSVMILRHDKVVAEMYPKPFNEAWSHTLYSCSKTFVSAAVGILVGEGRLKLTDRVASFFPESLPDTLSDNLKHMTVRDLLTMTSGIEPDWNMRSVSTTWVKSYLSKPVSTPGRLFKYDSICTYLLSAIVQKVSGQTLLGFLRQRIFAPLGIKNVQWQVSPEGYNTGGWGLYLQSESMAKFGLLLLHRGVWKGKQLIPAGWVDEMMKKQTPEGQPSYGYQMWPCPRKGSARADGAYGQYIFIIPDKDMVVVVTQSSTFDGSREHRLLWNYFMPQVRDKVLPVNPGGVRHLAAGSKRVLPFVKGISGISHALLNHTFKLSPNRLHWKSVAITGREGRYTLCVTDEEGLVTRIALGYKCWKTTATKACPAYPIWPKGVFNGIKRRFLVSASYGSTGDRLDVTLHYVNWITPVELSFEPSAGGVGITARMNHEATPFIIRLLPG